MRGTPWQLQREVLKAQGHEGLGDALVLGLACHSSRLSNWKEMSLGHGSSVGVPSGGWVPAEHSAGLRMGQRKSKPMAWWQVPKLVCGAREAGQDLSRASFGLKETGFVTF